MGIGAAIIGSAVIGGASTAYSASRARSASRYGADTAAQAQVDSTRMQVEEMQRQFDAQMEMLGPLMESQYAALAFFSDVLGFGGYNSETGEWDGGGPAAMGFGREGGFMDPNLNPMQLGYEDWQESPYGQEVISNMLATGEYGDDVAVRRALETQLGGTDFRDDPRYQYYLETGNLVGDEFETSPGFEFAMENMRREIDRKHSAGGGNYGGRALMEATRRAEGIANQDYYNWINQRRMDLDRGDRTLDTAYRSSQRREEMNLARRDTAFSDWMRRREGDTTRRDRAALENRGMLAMDRQRQDQGYYNWLNMITGAANTGAVDQGVGASARTGAGIANAYANEGNWLSRIWSNYGDDRANIAMAEGAGINNVLQGALRNWLFADHAGLLDT